MRQIELTRATGAAARGRFKALLRRGRAGPLATRFAGATRPALAAAIALGLATIAATPASAQGYGLRPGDVLRIEVVEDPDLNRTVLVAPDGSISFPFAGNISAQGRTVEQIRSQIVEGISDQFAAGRAPTVFVSLERVTEPELALPPEPELPPVMDVYITGEIANPGRLDVTPGTTILQVVAQAGGLTRFAADSRILLRRIDPRTGLTLDYRFDFAGGTGGISPATVLAPGDVIVVPERRLFEFD